MVSTGRAGLVRCLVGWLGLLLGVVGSPAFADPSEAMILSPNSSITVSTGQAIGFSASSMDSGDREGYSVNGYAWNFGNGATSSAQNPSYAYPAPGTYTVTLTVTYTYRMCKVWSPDGGCKTYRTMTDTASAERTVTVQTPPKPTINSFVASPGSITAGSSTTLYWDVSGATNLSIDQNVGSVNGSSRTVSPASSVTYTLTATNAQGSVTATANVTVYAAPVASGLTASANPIPYGGTVVLTPTYSGGTGVITPGNYGTVSGSPVTLGPLITNTTYTLTVTNPLGVKATQTLAVGVQTVAVTIQNAPSVFTSGSGTYQFSASVSGAVNTSVTWKAQFYFTSPVTGETVLKPDYSMDSSGLWNNPSIPATYVITATSNADPTRKATAGIEVVNAPSIMSFTAAANPILYNSTASLTPVFSDGTGRIDPGGGTVTTGTAWQTPALTAQTTYTLTVTNAAGGTTASSLTVNVHDVTMVQGADFTGGYLTQGVDTAILVSGSVYGAANTNIRWSADQGTFSKTVSASGEPVAWYPPATPGHFNVYATSVAKGSVSVSRAYDIVAPATATLAASTTTPPRGGKVTLTPTFSGSSATLEPCGGTLTSSGNPVQSCDVTGSVQYKLTTWNAAGRPAYATLTLTPQTVAVTLGSAPSSVTAGIGTYQFSATVVGAVDASVTWKAQFYFTNPTTGQTVLKTDYSINSNGLWTIPSTPAAYVITATSNADPTKIASVGIEVVNAPFITSFAAATNPVPYGSTASLTPVFTDGSGRIDPGPVVATSGTAWQTPPLIAGTTYTLTVTNAAGGNATSSLRVNVQDVTMAYGGTFTGGYLTRGLDTAVQVSAKVYGAANTTIRWTADQGNFSKTVSDSDEVVYWYPPAATGHFNVYATSIGKESVSLSRAYDIVAPATASLAASTLNPPRKGTVTLTPTFSGSSATLEPCGGTLTISGNPVQSCEVTAAVQYKLTTWNLAGTPAYATVNLTPQAVAVTLGSSPNLFTADSAPYRFLASVTGAIDRTVTWKCTQTVTKTVPTQYGGTTEIQVTLDVAIGTDGTWTIPSDAGAYVVTATSNADTSKSASLSVTVVAAPAIGSFTATPASVPRGGSASLLAEFDCGNGGRAQVGIQSGSSIVSVRDVTSGVAWSTGALDTGTTYVLTVTNAAGQSVTQTLMVDLKTVTVTPTTLDLIVGESRALTAVVTGLPNTTVTWSCPEGGNVTSGGVFTAPDTAGTYRILAGNSDGSLTDECVATVHARLTLTPASPVVVRGALVTFIADVKGASAQDVSWSASAGSITSAGAYTAPTAFGSYTVTATSTTDPAVKATAQVTVANFGPVFSEGLGAPLLCVGQSASLVLPAATDPEGDNPVSYQVSGLPPGLSFESSTRRVTGTPSQTGLFPVVLTATDSLGMPSDPLGGSWPVQTADILTEGPAPTLPEKEEEYDKTHVKFSEVLSYSGSETGLITAVDVTRELQARVAAMASGRDKATQSRYTYGYDPLGQLVTSSGTFSNPNSQVDNWTDYTTYGYDAHGNRKAHLTAKGSDWVYQYYPNSNQLKSAGEFSLFEYTKDGAVSRIVRNGLEQTFAYKDPRHMRLPTRIVRQSDERMIESDITYDMSGTRVYKRDYVRKLTVNPAVASTTVSGPLDLISDRETYYLANGTEVLMEVEAHGKVGDSRENPAAAKLSAERMTAYIFGAGSRLARISWDKDGQGTRIALLNAGFENGTESWVPSSVDAGLAVTDSAAGAVAKVVNLTGGSDHLEQSLGTCQSGDTLYASAWVRSEAGVAAARLELVQAGGATQASADVTGLSWQPLTASWVVPATGEVKVRLRAVGAGSLSGALFDEVLVRRQPPSTLVPEKPNLWPDPGFESFLGQGGGVAALGQVTIKDVESGSSREGLHVLHLDSGATYSRTVSGLDPAKRYLFSIWTNPGNGWTRVTRPDDEINSGRSGSTWTITLAGPGDFDQAEVVENPGGIPESWIPENRLGRVDWFITDHLGSTKLLIDQNGQHRFTGDDDPFGINLRSFGDKDTHRFTGQILDEDQGVYYYGARYYLPEIGRFLSGDPAKDHNSIYLYAGNRPITSTDPTGCSEAPKQQFSVNGVNYGMYYSSAGRGTISNDGRMVLGSYRFLNTDTMEEVYQYNKMGPLPQRGYNAMDDAEKALNLYMTFSMGKDLLSLGKSAFTAAESAWTLGQMERGLLIESRLIAKAGGEALPAGFKRLDYIVGKKMVSVKSIDLAAKTYQNANRLESLVKGYVDKVAGFAGASKGGVTITKEMAAGMSRTLELAVPKGVANSGQNAALQAGREYGASRGVEVIIKEIR